MEKPWQQDEVKAVTLRGKRHRHGSHSASSISTVAEEEEDLHLLSIDQVRRQQILSGQSIQDPHVAPQDFFLFMKAKVDPPFEAQKFYIPSLSLRGAKAEPPYDQATPSIADLTESSIGDFEPRDAMKFETVRGFLYGGSTESSTNPTIGTHADTFESDQPPQTRPNIDDLAERQGVSKPTDAMCLEILKSIVHGGLIESVASLGVVTSAASVDADIWTIIALSSANLIGGILIIAHNLWNLKVDQTNKQVDHYQELLGRRKNFALHVTVAMLSFLVSGLLPPVVYGFTFMESNDRVFKLAAVTVASLLCITVLAIGKAYIQKPPKSYINTVLHYTGAGIAVLVVYCIAGELAKKLTEKLLWLNSGESVVILPFGEMSSGRSY